MKNLKKLFFVSMLSVVTVISVACSSGNNSSNTTTTTTKSLTNDEILAKFYESTKSIKSADVKTTADVTITPEGEGQKAITTKTSISGTVFSNPLSFKLDMSTAILGQNIDISMYYKDNTVYMKSSEMGSGVEWLKTSDPEILKELTALNKQGVGDANSTLELFKNKIDGTKVEEKDGKYEISFSGNPDAAKDVILDILSESFGSNPVALEEIKKNMTFKSFSTKYIVDKSTFLPISLDTTMEIEIISAGQKGTIKAISNEKYENINKASELVIPDEVKNAKDINEA